MRTKENIGELQAKFRIPNKNFCQSVTQPCSSGTFLRQALDLTCGTETTTLQLKPHSPSQLHAQCLYLLLSCSLCSPLSNGYPILTLEIAQLYEFYEQFPDRFLLSSYLQLLRLENLFCPHSTAADVRSGTFIPTAHFYTLDYQHSSVLSVLVHLVYISHS